jgi:hypothetical protein
MKATFSRASRMLIIGELATRDGWRCQICDKNFAKHRTFDSSRSAVTVDHIRPKSVGGSDGLSNLRLAHRHCNSERNQDSYGEWYEEWLEENTSYSYDSETLSAMEESDNFRDIVLGLR